MDEKGENIFYNLNNLTLKRIMKFLVRNSFYVFLLSIIFIYLYIHHDFSIDTFRGSGGHSRFARFIIESKFYLANSMEAPLPRAPVYPVFLSLLMIVFGKSYYIAATLLQAIIVFASVYLAYRISYLIFENRFISRLTVILLAIDVAFIKGGIVQHETVFMMFSIMWYFFYAFKKEQSTRDRLLMGVAAALAFLTRPSGGLFIFMISGEAVAFALRKQEGWKWKTLLPSVTLLICIFPWLALNYSVKHQLTYSASSGSGTAFYMGNNPYFRNLFPYVEMDLMRVYSMHKEELHKRFGEKRTEFYWNMDKFFFEKGVEFIKENPLKWAENTIFKAMMFYSLWYLPMGNGNVILEDGKPVGITDYKIRISPTNIGNFIFSVIVIVGFFLFIFTQPYWKNFDIMSLLFFMAMTTALYAIYFVETRHRLPVDPIMAILAAKYYGDKILRRIGEGGD